MMEKEFLHWRFGEGVASADEVSDASAPADGVVDVDDADVLCSSSASAAGKPIY
jgi:hypothetical protein